MNTHVYPLMMHLLRLSVWLSLLVLIFVPLERIFSLHEEKLLRKGWGADLVYYFLSSVIPTVLLSVPVGFLASVVHWAIPSEVLSATRSMPIWCRILSGLVAGEVGYYWGHRLSHEIPFLWRFHSIHHSAQHLDFMVNTRAHPLDMVFSRFCSLVPIYLLGLGGPPETVTSAGTAVPLAVTLFGTVWGFFIHSNLRCRLGPLEWLVVTPAFHHWHHTLNGPINHNYSSTLPWLDRIFGTHFLPRNAWPDAYGADGTLPNSLAGQLIHPFRSPELLPKPSDSWIGGDAFGVPMPPMDGHVRCMAGREKEVVIAPEFDPLCLSAATRGRGGREL
jgi:sterol desaturase/sphingolipid hydroxylase (fatty acid hydroxylase superfamily)